MLFHISVKKKLIDRHIRHRLRCEKCGYTMHHIFGEKETLSLFFIPFLSRFVGIMRCLGCYRLTREKSIHSQEIRRKVHSLAFKASDYIFGFFLPFFTAMVIIIGPPVIFGTIAFLGKMENYSKPYAFYDACADVTSGGHFIVDLYAYNGAFYNYGRYAVGFIKASRSPRIFNPSNNIYEEKVFLRYVLSREHYGSEEDVIHAIQRGDDYAAKYYEDKGEDFTALKDFQMICHKSFKGIKLIPVTNPANL